MGIEQPYLSHVRQFHLIGIGGIGMSGIARLLLELGYGVSGSDIHVSPLTRRLETDGARIFEGHDASQLDGAQAVIVSSAVPETNAELQQARRRNLPVIHRSVMLAELMSRQRGIAVSGTHGKSTTTSMIGVVFERQGVDPTIVVGGELNDLGGNAKLGRGDYFIAEVDESDGSLLNIHPNVAVVTNIEAEHLDYYGNEKKLVDTFREFLRNLPETGRAVICGDCPNAMHASEFMNGRRLTYGFGVHCEFVAVDIEGNGFSSRFRVLRNGHPLGELTVGVPGRQNVLNALATTAAALEAGVGWDSIVGALAEFHGIRRRFERVAQSDQYLLIDDYAHHPSEIRATLRAAHDGFPGRRVVCAFQPHRYTRTKLLGDQFGSAFQQADHVLLTDVYPAGEKPVEGVSGALVVEAIHRHDPDRSVEYVPRLDDIPDVLASRVRPGDLVLTLGAGDIWKAAVRLAKRLNLPAKANPPGP